MILVMTALGKFRSSGRSAIAAARDCTSNSGLSFGQLRRLDFPRRCGLTQRGFRPVSQSPTVPQCPARTTASLRPQWGFRVESPERRNFIHQVSVRWGFRQAYQYPHTSPQIRFFDSLTSHI